MQTVVTSELTIQFAQLMADVAADFGDVLDEIPTITVFDRARNLWMTTNASIRHPQVDGGFDPDAAFVVHIGSNGFVVEEPGFPSLAIALVNALQGTVMDNLNRGWPERVNDDGVFLGLAEPARGPGGDLGWRVGNETPVPFGQLKSMGTRLSQ